MSFDSSCCIINVSKTLASSHTIPGLDVTLSSVHLLGNLTVDPSGAVNIQGDLIANNFTAINTVNSGQFGNFSDKRIKYDIQTYDNLLALEQLESVRITTFKKIDDKLNQVNIGFIAQELEKVIPASVDKMTNHIPDIYQWIDCIYKKEEKEIIIDNKFNLKFRTRVKIIDENEKEFTTTVIDTENGKTVLLLDDSNCLPIIKNRVFVYGKKINDFHFVYKDYVFAVAISATQELSKKIKTQDQTIKDLTSRLENLEAKLVIEPKSEPVKKTRSKKTIKSQ